jgi:ArsR family transcriptional regulator
MGSISVFRNIQELHERTTPATLPPMSMNQRPDDPEGLRQFKAEFFKALAHPVRIRIVELLRDRPMSVGQLQAAIGVPPSSVSQQLAVLRSRGLVTTDRRGTTVIYAVRDPDIFELLDVARRIFNAHLSDTIDLLRLVEAEPEGVATP